MDRDTDIGGSRSRFPTTRRTAIAAIRGGDETERARALDSLLAAYWKPVYKYLRWKWGESNEDAKDLTQGFFALAIEKRYFEAFDPGRAKFRTYLRVCLDGFVSNEKKKARRLKRSPEPALEPLDFEAAERELARQPAPEGIGTDDYFHREWVRSLFAIALDGLREECGKHGKESALRLFELYDLEEETPGERMTYETLATRFSLTVPAVTNQLAWARREFRRVLLAKLRDLTGSDAEFRAEARALLGGERD